MNAIPLLPADARWCGTAQLALYALFAAGMLLGMLCLGLGLLCWVLGANLLLFFPALVLGVFDRSRSRDDLQDDHMRWLWRLHLYLLPPVTLVAAAALVLGG